MIGTLAACGDDGSSGTINLIAPSGPATEYTDLNITAQRTGGSSGSVSITFSTAELTATPDVDYTAATGTVTWEDGDTEDKIIAIPILDDYLIEDDETLTVVIAGDHVGDGSVEATIDDDDHIGDSIAVTSAGRMLTFDKATPNRFTYAVDLSGLGGETIVGLDARPADGKFYALTGTGKLYTINGETGAATLVSTLVADASDATSPFTGLMGTDVGIDFNPVVDRLRVTTSTGQNLRVNVDTGATITDTAINGLSTGYGAIAYSNSVGPACRTTLYAIDVATNRFLSQNPPNDGVATGIGGLGLDPTASGGFDVATDAAGASTGVALLTVDGATAFYTIDLGSGAATSNGAMFVPAGETVLGFASAPLAPTTPVTQLAGELYGATTTGLVSFNRASSDKLCSSKPFTGLVAGEVPLAIDVRPSTGVLYVLTRIGTAGKLHRVDPATGNLSPAIPISVALAGTEFGMDFNPTGVVPLRIVSNTGQNLRVTDLTTGAATADTALNGASTQAVGAAYTDSVQGAGSTTLYVIDASTDRLAIQNPPNSGLTVDVGPLGVDIGEVSGFDIDGRDNSAVLAVTTGNATTLHSINVATGAVSAALGTVGGGAPLIGIARVTPTTNVFGLTTDNKLFRLSLADPSMITPVGDPMVTMPVDGTITGLAAGENLVGIDIRPGSNILFAVGSLGNVYTVNSSTATANNLGPITADPTDTSAPFAGLSGTSFGFDFNPTGPVALRVISNTEQNLRIPNVSIPTAFTDTVVTPAGEATAAAYSNSFVAPAGVTATTTLYVIDVSTGQLMSAANPNNGVLTPVGPLAAGTVFGDPTVVSPNGFDIGGGNNGIALAALQLPTATPGVLETSSRLYRIDLATGAATAIGPVGGSPLRGLAIQIR